MTVIERSATKGWAAVGAVAVGIFSLVTTDLLPIGLLTPIQEDLDVSEGTAGLMVTVPSMTAAASATVISVAAGRMDRRTLLGLLLGIVSIANLLTALSSSFPVVLAARLLIGIGVGGFWAIAGGLALRLVPEDQVGRATAVIFGGVSVASVLGVPAGTLIGDFGGWRSAFVVVGLLGLVSLVALAYFMPPLPSTSQLKASDLTALLRSNKPLQIGLLLTFLLVTGHFAAYTFVRPILHDVSGLAEWLISGLLLAYGLAGVAGNFLAGSRAAADPRRTLFAISVGITAVLVALALALTEGIPFAGIGLLVIWGIAYGGVSVSLQNWMFKAAPSAPEASTGLFVAVFNLSVALGALVGGLLVDSLGLASVLWLAGALIAAAAFRLNRS